MLEVIELSEVPMKLKDFISSNEIVLIIIGIFLLFPLFGNAQVGSKVSTSSIQQVLNNQGGDPRLVGLHFDKIQKLYEQRNMQPIWVDPVSQTMNPNVQSLRTMLLTAYRHGLPAEFMTEPNGKANYISWNYWTPTMENIWDRKSQFEPLYFEILATEAFLKYAQHLLTGRFDPRGVDPNIKMGPRVITAQSYVALANALAANPSELSARMDRFAPSNPAYKGLSALNVKLIKEQLYKGNWKKIESPGVTLKLQSPTLRHAIIPELRQRLAFYGYPTQNLQSDEFDSDLKNALVSFQTMNNLTPDGEVGANVSKVLRYLNMPISQRMQHVAINMERLRWLPRNPSSKEIFVNLAMTEFKLYEISADENKRGYIYKEALKFKTVNGRGVRQSPIRIDAIKRVILNPDWTVPENLARVDKLPLLKQNANYLNEHNMYLKKYGKIVPSETIDWNTFNPDEFQNGDGGYQIVQKPGYMNALGVVKFELQAGELIYMHDTNERELFQQENRHGSSGCIRLEKPLVLAEYLKPFMKTSPGDIKSLVPASENDTSKTFQTKWISMKYSMPVYLIYLTADQTPDGKARFADDPYEQDPKLVQALADAAARGDF
ncbi:L,D-transpeptidase family protein [Bdellovibrio sp. HCB209]|uniref:L,D-transpeptidase family protein n=1 Tax=Bdellovibrio sp. HCB209 TaxID=3394354 RepID=UPI0039B3E729